MRKKKNRLCFQSLLLSWRPIGNEPSDVPNECSGRIAEKRNEIVVFREPSACALHITELSDGALVVVILSKPPHTFIPFQATSSKTDAFYRPNDETADDESRHQHHRLREGAPGAAQNHKGEKCDDRGNPKTDQDGHAPFILRFSEQPLTLLKRLMLLLCDVRDGQHSLLKRGPFPIASCSFHRKNLLSWRWGNPPSQSDSILHKI